MPHWPPLVLETVRGKLSGCGCPEHGSLWILLTLLIWLCLGELVPKTRWLCKAFIARSEKQALHVKSTSALNCDHVTLKIQEVYNGTYINYFIDATISTSLDPTCDATFFNQQDKHGKHCILGAESCPPASWMTYCTYMYLCCSPGLPAQLPIIEGYNPTGRPFIYIFHTFWVCFTIPSGLCGCLSNSITLWLPKPCVFAWFVQVLLPIRRSLAEEGAALLQKKVCFFLKWPLVTQRDIYIYRYSICIYIYIISPKES